MDNPSMMNKPINNEPKEVISPPPIKKKKSEKPLSGYIVIIRVDDDGITIVRKMPENPSSNIYVLKLDEVYRMNLDEKEVESRNPRKKIKPFNQREKKKQGFFGQLFNKKKELMTSLNTLFDREQNHADLPEIDFVTFHKNIQDAKSMPKIEEADKEYIEARTSDNKRAVMDGGGKFSLALNMIKKQAAQISNKLKEPIKQMTKDILKEEVQHKMHGGLPDFIGDAKKLVKYTLYLPANSYKAIQNKSKAIYKEIKGGNYKKAKKSCDDLKKQCAKKCQRKQKGGGCGCKGKCHCKKPGQCGGAKFNIHSKENQEFGKALQKRYNKKADKLKADIKVLRKFKKELQKLPAKDFNNNLKSRKHMSNSQKKKLMIDRQNKKILAKKQAIKDHELKVYGPFRPKM